MSNQSLQQTKSPVTSPACAGAAPAVFAAEACCWADSARPFAVTMLGGPQSCRHAISPPRVVGSALAVAPMKPRNGRVAFSSSCSLAVAVARNTLAATPSGPPLPEAPRAGAAA